MNAQEFNLQLNAMFQRAFKSLQEGTLSPFEAIGIIETNSDNFRLNLRIASQAAAQAAQANKIITPPGTERRPGIK